MKKILTFSAILFTSSLLSFTYTEPSEPDGVRKAFVGVSAQTLAPSGELTQRFVEYSSYGRGDDVLLMQLYNSVYLPEDEVQRLLDGFD